MRTWASPQPHGNLAGGLLVKKGNSVGYYGLGYREGYLIARGKKSYMGDSL